jgi:glutamyl/glutaminyl-tRNA synthetase
VHRPLYDWILDALEIPEPRPHQYEFARFNLTYSVMSKRKLIQLVNEKARQRLGRSAYVDNFRFATARCQANRIARVAYKHRNHQIPSMTDMALLEHTVRDELNRAAVRRLVVLRPIKVVLTNYPQEKPKNSTRSTIRRIQMPAHAKFHSAASFTSNAMISWKRRHRSIFACDRGRGAPENTLTSSNAKKW